jgi:hypothetical protein
MPWEPVEALAGPAVSHHELRPALEGVLGGGRTGGSGTEGRSGVYQREEAARREASREAALSGGRERHGGREWGGREPRVRKGAAGREGAARTLECRAEGCVWKLAAWPRLFHDRLQ